MGGLSLLELCLRLRKSAGPPIARRAIQWSLGGRKSEGPRLPGNRSLANPTRSDGGGVSPFPALGRKRSHPLDDSFPFNLQNLFRGPIGQEIPKLNARKGESS